MRRLLLAVLLLSPLSVFAAEDSKENPIDRAMDAAVDRDPSTAGMVKAYSDANTQWDKTMNVVYKALKSKMEDSEWQALAKAQKDWLVFRDAQEKSIEATFSKMEGTMWIPVSTYKVMELTRERALYLQALLDTVSER